MMKVNKAKLKGKMVENEITQEKMCELLGISPATFWRKARSGYLTFTVGEMHKMADVLHLTGAEASDIFLSDDSQKC